MKIKTQNYNDVTVLELQGVLDIDSIEQLESAIYDVTSAGKCALVLDLSGVGFIDSTGLQLLISARDHCNDNKCQFRIAGLDQNCEKIFQITRLDQKFDCYAELAEAVKSFA